MSDIHVFTNGADYYAAQNLDEAEKMYKKFTGEDFYREEWEQKPDDEMFEVWIENEGVAEHGTGHKEKASFRYWALQLGKGFLFSTEY